MYRDLPVCREQASSTARTVEEREKRGWEGPSALSSPDAPGIALLCAARSRAPTKLDRISTSQSSSGYYDASYVTVFAMLSSTFCVQALHRIMVAEITDPFIAWNRYFYPEKISCLVTPNTLTTFPPDELRRHGEKVQGSSERGNEQLENPPDFQREVWGRNGTHFIQPSNLLRGGVEWAMTNPLDMGAWPPLTLLCDPDAEKVIPDLHLQRGVVHEDVHVFSKLARVSEFFDNNRVEMPYLPACLWLKTSWHGTPPGSTSRLTSSPVSYLDQIQIFPGGLYSNACGILLYEPLQGRVTRDLLQIFATHQRHRTLLGAELDHSRITGLYSEPLHDAADMTMHRHVGCHGCYAGAEPAGVFVFSQLALPAITVLPLQRLTRLIPVDSTTNHYDGPLEGPTRAAAYLGDRSGLALVGG